MNDSRYIYFTLDDNIEGLVYREKCCPHCGAPLTIDLQYKENKKHCSSYGYEDNNKKSLKLVTKSMVLEGRV